MLRIFSRCFRRISSKNLSQKTCINTNYLKALLGVARSLLHSLLEIRCIWEVPALRQLWQSIFVFSARIAWSNRQFCKSQLAYSFPHLDTLRYFGSWGFLRIFENIRTHKFAVSLTGVCKHLGILNSYTILSVTFPGSPRNPLEWLLQCLLLQVLSSLFLVPAKIVFFI